MTLGLREDLQGTKQERRRERNKRRRAQATQEVEHSTFRQVQEFRVNSREEKEDNHIDLKKESRP
ncbi:MAG: hypothetical protein ACRDL7_14875 [Gaiellaceae bacterium]